MAGPELCGPSGGVVSSDTLLSNQTNPTSPIRMKISEIFVPHGLGTLAEFARSVDANCGLKSEDV